MIDQFCMQNGEYQNKESGDHELTIAENSMKIQSMKLLSKEKYSALSNKTKSKMKLNMKKLFIIAATLLFFNVNMFAQDWSKKDAKSVKTLVDTNLVHAMEITIMPGEKGQEHTHPAHYFYALTDCHLMVHYTNGKTEEFKMKAGDSGFSNAEGPHRTENKGDKPAKFLLVELKEHPYKPEKNK